MTDIVATPVARRATIVEVARRAGVSIGTVSLALSGSRRCSPATAGRVRAVVAELGYMPDHAASSLRRRSTDSVALVIPDIGNPVYVAMAKSVQLVAKQRGYHLSLVSTDGAPREEVHAVEALARRQVDGLILCSLRSTPELVRALEAAPAPVCVIGRAPSSAEVDNVRVDSELGAVLAVGHLVAQGCRSIAFVNGAAGTVPAEARQRGFERGLIEAGLEPDPELVLAADFTVHAGHAAVDGLISARPDLDAVFCANDVIALGVLRRLRERSVPVPGRVAVVGMDDIEQAEICAPTLSSVSLGAAERGRLAAELLLDRLAATGPVPPRLVSVPPRLVVRESSARVGISDSHPTPRAGAEGGARS